MISIPTRPSVRLAVVLLLAIAQGGCGGSNSQGGGASAASPQQTTVLVTTYYDPGTRAFPMESGRVLVGLDGVPTSTKQGLWTAWFPPAQGNGKHFDKTYVSGAWATDQYWREWNSDTSMRFDWRDQ